MKLQTYLTRLIWWCIAPLLLLAAYMAFDALREMEARRDREAERIARNVAATIDRHIEAQIAALQMLVTSPAADDPARRKELYDAAQRFRESFGSHVLLADPSGQMLFNTRVPLGGDLPKLPRVRGNAAAPTALATGMPAVGDQFMGPVAGEPLVALAVPVLRPGQPTHLLVAVMASRQFQQRLDQLSVRADWVVTLQDGKQEVIARRALEIRSPEAESRRFIAQPSLAPWTVIVETSSGLPELPTLAAGAVLLAMIVAATFAGVIGGRVAGRQLTRTLASLGDPAARTAQGEDESGPEIVEVGAIRRRLADQADERRAAQATLRLSEERFRRFFEEAPLPLLFVANDGTILALNARFTRTFGYTRDDVPNLTEWRRRAYPEASYREQTVRAWDSAVERARGNGGDIDGGQVQVTCKNGSSRVVLVSGIAFEEGMLVASFDVTERAQAVAALRQSEAELREAQRLAGVGTWRWNLLTDEHVWSDEVHRIYGCDPALGPVKYPEIERYLTPASWSHVSATVERAIADGQSYECDAEVVRPDGTHRWIVARGQPVLDAAGKVVELHGTVQDITQRKQAEEQIRKLSLAVEQSPASIVITDLEARIEYVNDAFLRNSGYGRDEVMGRNVSLLQSGRTSRETYAGMWSTLGEGRSWTGEFVNRRKDGTEYVERAVIAPIRQGDGRVTHYVGVQEDVTEQKRLAEELARHRDHLEEMVAARTAELEQANRTLAERAQEIADLYDRAPCGYHSLAPDGTILAANQTELAMLGYSREQYVGRRIGEFMTAASREAFRARFEEFRRTGRARDLEYEAVRADGSILPVLINADIVRGPDGEFLYNRATMVDNSERKARERQIAQMQEELVRRAEAAEVANVAKSAFLANMSHEIRTPMNAILGFAQLLRRDPVTPEQAERLDKIGTAGKHLLSVINDILDLSKIEAGKLVLEDTDFPLSAVLDGVRSFIADAAERKGLAIGVDYDDVPVWLRGDPTRLRQALLNFAGNAVKFTDKGSVSLRAKLLAEMGDELLVRFEVEDTGVGIPADKLSLLFQAFQQVDSSTTRRFGGTGLGLTIAQQLARLMGGEVGVSSVPGQGSTFWFTARLGRSDVSPTAVIYKSARDAESRLRDEHQGARLLLAEDDPINQEVAIALLEDVGLRVDVAGDGRQAVAMAKRNRYALILMDMQMPEMDGLAATRAIRAEPGLASTPVLALTANAFDEDRRRCMEAGMNDFVPKPFFPEELFGTVLKWLERDGP